MFLSSKINKSYLKSLTAVNKDKKVNKKLLSYIENLCIQAAKQGKENVQIDPNEFEGESLYNVLDFLRRERHLYTYTYTVPEGLNETKDYIKISWA